MVDQDTCSLHKEINDIAFFIKVFKCALHKAINEIISHNYYVINDYVMWRVTWHTSRGKIESLTQKSLKKINKYMYRSLPIGSKYAWIFFLGNTCSTMPRVLSEFRSRKSVLFPEVIVPANNIHAHFYEKWYTVCITRAGKINSGGHIFIPLVFRSSNHFPSMFYSFYGLRWTPKIGMLSMFGSS